MRRFILAVILVLGTLVLRAEPRVSDFKSYQVTNGLSSNTITGITQDRLGFMWFGSRNGLNRFDGHSFKVFQQSDSNPRSLGSNTVLSLCPDQADGLWVGTTRGLYHYDHRQESFQRFRAIPSSEIRYLQPDGEAGLWIVAAHCLYRYAEGRLTLYVFPKDQTTAIHLSGQGQFYASTENGHLYTYNRTRHRFAEVELPNFSRIDQLQSLGDTSLILQRGNRAFIYHLQKQQLRPLGGEASLDIRIHSFLPKADGTYYLATEAGLYLYQSASNRLHQIQNQYGNPYSLSDRVFLCLYQDREKGIWMGTSFGGVNYYSEHLNHFSKLVALGEKNSLSGKAVHSIQKDSQGQLWVGTEDAGLNKINLHTHQIESFQPGKGTGGISYHNIHGLLADSARLWIGTLEHGLDVMDLRTQKIIRHYRSSPRAGSFSSDFIVTLYKRRNGQILVGTWNGLFAYRPERDDFVSFPSFTIQIQSIHESADGTLWVGSYGNGVYFYNEKTGRRGHLTTRQGLKGNYVNHVYEDFRHQFWFCCENGLSRYDPLHRQFVNYSKENGLPDNQVFRIESDHFGYLWISTGRGLARFMPRTNQWQHYFTAHGLPTDQFNYNSSFKDSSGRLYFGTVKGLVCFDPASFTRTNRFVPPVYITGIQINNQELSINAGDSVLPQSIVATSRLELSHRQSNISLDVAALSYTNPEINQYRYKLEGVDPTWVNLSNNRRIYYSNLPPGSYVFQLQGSNNDGVWNPSQRLLTFVIKPPYYATPWAYLLYASLTAAIGYIIFRYYHLALTEKNKRELKSLEMETQKAVYSGKIEFFTNVAHEIRTPLTLIKLPLDKLLGQFHQDSLIRESLQIMNKHTNRLIDLTNQLLDFRKAEAQHLQLHFSNTDIHVLLNELGVWFKPVAEERNLSFKLELPRLTLHAFVDEEAFRKIMTNLLSNALKYADSMVMVKLLPFSSEDDVFQIQVINDGPVIPASLQEKIFEPFFRLRETSQQPGTGIGLALSRALAQLHQGTLLLENESSDRNSFRLSLPIHQEIPVNLQSFSEPAEAEAAPAPAAQADPSKPSLLLVEDQREIGTYLQQELHHTYNIFLAYHGEQALELLQQENIQLVVSDIMMPRMDGIELCRRVKSDLAYSHIPVILLTARTSLQSKVTGLEVGADAYLEKPFSVIHLQAQIESLLANRNRVKQYFARSPLSPFKGMAYTPADKDFLEQLHQVIYDHILDPELNVDQLSQLMNMSRPTLYRKIKGLSDLSPNELINLSRLKKAAELLATGHFKVNEAAALVGYSLPTNFSRDFQKQFGITPSQYMLDNKSR